jgi:hypothetical protein
MVLDETDELRLQILITIEKEIASFMYFTLRSYTMDDRTSFGCESFLLNLSFVNTKCSQLI